MVEWKPNDLVSFLESSLQDDEQKIPQDVGISSAPIPMGMASENMAFLEENLAMEDAANPPDAMQGLDPGGMMVPAEVGQGLTPDEAGGLKAAGMGALQGATFNLADEAVGLVSDSWKQSMRESASRLQKKYPKSFVAGEVGGALAAGLATGAPIASGLRAGQAATRLGLLGGIEGGLAAVGEQNVESPGQLDQGQIKTGMFLGGAFGATAPAAANAVRRVAQKFLSRQKGLNKSARLLLQDAETQRMTPTEYLDPARKDPQLDIAASRRGTRELSKDAAKMHEEAASRFAKIIDDRRAGQGQRLMDSIEPEMGNASSVERLDQLSEWTRTQVRPEYERIHQMSMQPNQQTLALMNNPDFKKGLRIAERIARNQGAPFRYEPGMPMSGKMADYIQQGLREASEQGRETLTLKKTRLGKSIERLREKFLEDIDAQIPGFRRTRQQWAQLESAKEAEKIGRKWHTEKASRAIKAWEDMSSLEKEYAKHGFITEMTDRIKNVKKGANIADRFNTPKYRKILDTLIGQQGADKFFNQVATESAFNEFAKAIGRTRTTAPAFNTAITAPGSPVGLKFRLINMPLNMMKGGMDRESALAFAEHVLSQNVDEMLSAMNRVNPRLRPSEAAVVGLASRDLGQDIATGAGAAAVGAGMGAYDYFSGGS